MQTADAAQLVPGQIIVTRAPSGYLFVQIGRTKYTKRFNLSPTEARELIEELSALLGI
jgi:hypothetical protein